MLRTVLPAGEERAVIVSGLSMGKTAGTFPNW